MTDMDIRILWVTRSFIERDWVSGEITWALCHSLSVLSISGIINPSRVFL